MNILAEAIDRTKPMRDSGANQALITVDELTYTYPKTSEPAVSKVSFEVNQGEIFGLLGPSGAGKSTIQKILTRQNRTRDTANVSILGKPVNQWGQDLYEHIGVGFELPNHYIRMTARENLEFFASLYTRPTRNVDELLDMVGLQKGADIYVERFSKGMMMRLNFIRAIMHDPEILFLDEPTSGLDPVNAQLLKDIIRDLQKSGKTIVLTTHNMTDVEELCDRVGFMVSGQMKALSSVKELKAKYGQRLVNVEYQTSDSQLEKESFPMDKLAENTDFIQLLATKNIQTIHSQEASLDRVFAEVTGARLDSEN